MTSTAGNNSDDKAMVSGYIVVLTRTGLTKIIDINDCVCR